MKEGLRESLIVIGVIIFFAFFFFVIFGVLYSNANPLFLCKNIKTGCFKWTGTDGLFTHTSLVKIDCNSPNVEVRKQVCDYEGRK